MPQRFLRPGLRNSNRWNRVSRDAQALYIGILTLVDDYGRYDGRASVLCGEVFSVWNEIHPPEFCINPQQLAALCCQLHDSGLIDFYEIDGKKVLQITQWQERIREGCKEKWPENPNLQESAGIRSNLLPPPSPSPPSPASPPSPPTITPDATLKIKEDEIQLPVHLRTQRMQNIWAKWMTHRRAFKKPKNWFDLFKYQIEFLTRYTEFDAFKILDKSLVGGYQGLFEPDGKKLIPLPEANQIQEIIPIKRL